MRRKNKRFYWAGKEEKEEIEQEEAFESLTPAQQIMLLDTIGANLDGPPGPKDDFIEVSNNRIYFYSSIQRRKVMVLNKTLRELSTDIRHSATILESPPASIFLHINSHGGDLFTGLAAVDEIIKCDVPVTSIIDGCAASAATLMSIVADHRQINKHAYMLIHQLSSGMWGKYSELKDEIENLDRLMEMIKSIYTEYTKLPLDKLEKILEHDIWFDAETCLKYGLVDEII
jgi:ATP-dependent Clp endopeptidase proteolytic subunit ClpP